MNDINQQLQDWRTSLQNELSVLEQQRSKLNSAIDEKREKIRAIDKLTGVSEIGNGGPSGTATGGDIEDGAFTPIRGYWKPILQVLLEMGGRSRRARVIQLVGEKMSSILTEADRRKLPNSNFIRWENRVAWQTSNMRKEGLIEASSPRGVWEITDAGRKWLDDNR